MDLNEGIYQLLVNAINLNDALCVRDDSSFYELDDEKARIFYIAVEDVSDLEEEIKKAAKEQ